MQAQDVTLSDYADILRRRWRPALLSGILVAYAAIFIAYTLPAVYESSATILIEQQEIPEEFVQPTVTSYADERLQQLRQRVLATPRVSEIIERHGLYPEQRGAGTTTEDLVSIFRDNTSTSPHSVSSMHARTGRFAQITYAFQVSFRYHDPVKARDIVAELSSGWLEENEALRMETAGRTTSFLETEVARVEERLADTQSRLAEFKEQYADSLPDAGLLNLQAQDRLERELTDIENRLRDARERKSLLEAELAETPRFRPVLSDTGEPMVGGADRLAQLQQELIQARGRYSDSHPDVVRLRREIAALSDDSGGRASLMQQVHTSLASNQRELEIALDRLSPDHPDVIRLQRSVNSLEEQLAELERESGGATAAPAQPNNPPYLNLRTRIRTTDAELQDLDRRRGELRARLNDLGRRVAQSPQVERQYASLTREYDLLLAQYRDLRTKLSQAGLAETLETGQTGERLRIIEPAFVPSSPVQPNRVSLSFLGIVLAIAISLGVVSLVESADSRVRGQRDVRNLLEMPPLAIIPYIETPGDTRKRIYGNLAVAVVAVVAIGSLYERIVGI